LYINTGFFLDPKNPFHRQYEALRAFHIERKSAREVAKLFGFSEKYVIKILSQFRKNLEQGIEPKVFIKPTPGRNRKIVEDEIEQLIISLRKKNHSIVDIKVILDAKNIHLNLNQIDKILKEDGFAKLIRRNKTDMSQIAVPAKIKPPKCHQLIASELQSSHKFETRYGGVFLFLPLLNQLNFVQLIDQSEYPGTEQLSDFNYLLSFLFLKLIDKGRLSYVEQLSLDRGAGLFANLNVLPKSGSLSSYSYNTTRMMNRCFLKNLFAAIQKLYPYSA
jgi:transposase